MGLKNSSSSLIAYPFSLTVFSTTEIVTERLKPLTSNGEDERPWLSTVIYSTYIVRVEGNLYPQLQNKNCKRDQIMTPFR